MPRAILFVLPVGVKEFQSGRALVPLAGLGGPPLTAQLAVVVGRTPGDPLLAVRDDFAGGPFGLRRRGGVTTAQHLALAQGVIVQPRAPEPAAVAQRAAREHFPIRPFVRHEPFSLEWRQRG